jgi:hypothetical protein
MVWADIGENKKGSIIANWLCLISLGTYGNLYCRQAVLFNEKEYS